MGTKEKFWTEGPDGASWLFKYARVAVDGYISGEDWAEWLVCGLAKILGVPAAEILPAQCQGKRGLISRTIVLPGEELIHGNEILGAGNSGYDPNLTTENPNYRVGAVRDALDAASPQVPWQDLAGMTAFEVWAGYLTMDAWVSGCDRHDQNWGMTDDGFTLSLAPSFDHGNALGFQVRPEKHEQLLNDDDFFLRWLERGRCRYFAGRPRVTELAWEALALSSEWSRLYWLERLANVNMDAVVTLVHRVPETIMSVGTRRFVLQLLVTNRRRILDGNYHVDP
ncbi:hypothetical protein [Arthrobacter sp. TWP1-1]|uniref:hypothetical protein n=1 Tax=Arthrobacter sp. TWP1-1 TaxID=2804568 RepID=UPI003CF27E9B